MRPVSRGAEKTANENSLDYGEVEVEREIEAFGDSVALAREAAGSKVPGDHWILAESVLAKGGRMTLEGLGQTYEEALASARTTIPFNAKVLSESEVQHQRIDCWQVEATDQIRAELAARNRLPKNSTIAEVRQITSGSRGFLGFGARSPLFEVTSDIPSVVEVVFEKQAKVSLRIGRVGPVVGRRQELGLGDEAARLERIDGGYEILFNVRLISIYSGRFDNSPLLFLEAHVVAALLAVQGTVVHETAAEETLIDVHRATQSKVCKCGKLGFMHVVGGSMSIRGQLTVQYDCRYCGNRIALP